MQKDRTMTALGKWLPDRTLFKENRPVFIYALLVIVIMLVEGSSPFSARQGSAWPSFYLGACFRYLFRAAVVLIFVLALENKSLSSLGLRSFKKNGRVFWKEILITAGLCLMLLPGVKFTGSQPFYDGLSAQRLVVHAVYILFAVSLVEEVVWRGYVFSRLSQSLGKLPALFLSSFFMALWHLPYYLKILPGQGLSVLPSLAVAFVMSMILCSLLLLTEKLIGRWNIYPAVFLHWLGDIGYYLMNSLM